MAKRYISRSPRVSRVCVVPNCGTQVPPLPQARLVFATFMVVDAERVAVPAAKFRVSLRRYNWPGLLFCQLMKSPGVPSAGGVGPSLSEGRYPNSLLGVILQSWAAVELPASILVRSKAQRSAPMKDCPF